ncbi:MAG: hypothetical protein ACUVR8_02460 [Acidobacteriota bacterium]
MSDSDVSIQPVSLAPESSHRDPLQALPTLTRLVYRWCVGLINRTLERFPALQHGINRLEAAEVTIRRLRQERDEALGFLRERNHELAHYDTAIRNLFSVVSEVTHEMEDIRRALLTHRMNVAEHIQRHENDILQLQFRLEEAAGDMQEAQADLDGIELAVRGHLHRLGRRIEAGDLALLGMLEVVKETEEELDCLAHQLYRQHKLFSRVHGESVAENERLTQEINTLVAEAAQTNEVTAKHIRALEQELDALRSR